jgi:hypothetical protein
MGHFGHRPVAVMLGQLHHAFLHDVQSGLLVTHLVAGTLEGSSLNAFEKARQFLFGGHVAKAQMARLARVRTRAESDMKGLLGVAWA